MLGGLIEHVGFTPHSGHYVAYKRLFPESLEKARQDNKFNEEQKESDAHVDKWLQANDEKISIIKESQVLSRQRGAYLLFY